MQAYRIETTMAQKGKLTLTHVPFQQGEMVEIIILRRPRVLSHPHNYPLRGMVLAYEHPTEPVAQDDWGILS